MKNISNHSRKKESQSQILFNQYLREKKMPGFFELKVAKGGTFNFNDLKDHQYEGLQAANRNGLVWKLSDDDRRQKPCDTLSIPPLPAFLVIQFVDDFYLIHIDNVVKLKLSGHNSITKEEARNFAEIVVHI